MSLNIGTNFNYQGGDFLDSRQGLPKYKSDLKNWTIPIPLGFQACLDGTWYIWMGPNSQDDPEIGHWRVVNLSGGEGGTNRDADIDKLLKEVFKLKFTVTGGGTYEFGQTVNPRISWYGIRTGSTQQEYPSSSTLRKNNGTATQISNGTYEWTDPSQVSAPANYSDLVYRVTYKVTGVFSDGSYECTTEVLFKQKKYLGSITKDKHTALLDSNESTTIDYSSYFNSSRITHDGWADGDKPWTFSEKVVNCSWQNSEGTYPIYILPTQAYNTANSQFIMKVGGFNSTDYDVITRQMKNSSGYTSSYTFVILRTPQTGDNIPIQFV